MLMQKIRISDARSDIGWSQETLAIESGVSEPTVSRAETGKTILRFKARQIWNAINRGREAKGLQPLEFDDLDFRFRD